MGHYFIGIKAPASIWSRVEEYQQKHKLTEHYKVIPHPDDLHITLLFLGGVDEQNLPSIQRHLAHIAKNNSPFELLVDGFSFFGSPKGPRVVYLSTSQPAELDKLQKDIRIEISALLGMPEDHRFTPHITIAKKRKSDGPLQIAQERFNAIPFSVTEFNLFTIHPKNSPKYEAVEVYPFISRQ